MGRLTKALLVAGSLYIAHYLGEISGYMQGVKVMVDAYDKKEEEAKEETSEDIRIDRLESGIDLTSGNLNMLRGKVEDLEERFKILDTAFNYHIMDNNRHNMYGGN